MHVDGWMRDETATRLASALERIADTLENRRERYVLQAAGLTLDLAQRRVFLDGHELHLSRTEYDLLRFLLDEQPRVVPYRELTGRVLGVDCETDDDATCLLRSHIYNLRNKLKAVGDERMVRTVRNVGYGIRAAE